MADRLELARASYAAFAADDRDAIEGLLADDFEFFARPTPAWTEPASSIAAGPTRASVEGFDFVRLLEQGDEVVVTYEATRADGSRFRNTEVHTFRGDQIVKQEVYFGWDL